MAPKGQNPSDPPPLQTCFVSVLWPLFWILCGAAAQAECSVRRLRATAIATCSWRIFFGNTTTTSMMSMTEFLRDAPYAWICTCWCSSYLLKSKKVCSLKLYLIRTIMSKSTGGFKGNVSPNIYIYIHVLGQWLVYIPHHTTQFWYMPNNAPILEPFNVVNRKPKNHLINLKFWVQKRTSTNHLW